MTAQDDDLIGLFAFRDERKRTKVRKALPDRNLLQLPLGEIAGAMLTSNLLCRALDLAHPLVNEPAFAGFGASKHPGERGSDPAASLMPHDDNLRNVELG